MGPDISQIVLLAAFLLAGFLLRSYLILRFGWAGKDTYYHLTIARSIQVSGRLPDVVDRFAEPEVYDYPPLLHVILSRFPEAWHQRLQFLGPLSDTLAALVVYLFCLDVAGGNVALAAVAIYSFTPFNLETSFGLGPRPVANLLMVVCLVSAFYAITAPSLLPLAVALLSAALVLLTQRLAVQSLAAVLVAEAVVFSDLLPLVILVGAFPLALMLSRGLYLRVLRGHIAFIRVMGGRLLDPEKRKEQSSPLLDVKAIAFNLPALLFVPLLVLSPLPWTPLLAYAIAWMAGLLVLSAAWVFGEGYRHMANSVAAVAMAGGLWGANTGEWAIVYAVVLLSAALSLFKMFRLARRPDLGVTISGDALAAYRFIREHGGRDDVVLSIPTDLSYHAAYFTGMVTAHSSGGFARGLAFNCGLNRKVREGKVGEVVDDLRVRWIVSLHDALDLPGAVVRTFGPVRLYEVPGRASR